MNPEDFVRQDDVKRLLPIFMKFAQNFPVANNRQEILSGASIDSNFMSTLRTDATPVTFASTLLAKFREFRVSEQRFRYHPMECLLNHFLNTGVSLYGLDAQDEQICQEIVQRAQENFKALQARSAVGRIESPQGKGIGTGTLIGSNLVLTCADVFCKNQTQQAWIRFGYTQGSYMLEKDVFELDLSFEKVDNRLDFAMVRIQGTPERKSLLPSNKVLSSGTETKIRMIHHPQGQPVVISDVGQIVQAGIDYLDHNLKTDDGSSGAPIVDQEWEFVAIHRGHPGMSAGRPIQSGITTSLPISAMWKNISSYL